MKNCKSFLFQFNLRHCNEAAVLRDRIAAGEREVVTITDAIRLEVGRAARRFDAEL